MDEALIACRAVHFVSVMLAFGAGAFRLYAVDGSDPGALALLDARLRDLLLVSAIVAFLSALVLLPVVGSRMAGSASAALYWNTISAVLFNTSFGRVWRWHLLLAVLLVAASAVRRVPPGYRVSLAALLLASLGWVGHATIGEGRVGLAHEINQSVHLLASGIWLGGLVPLATLVISARRTRDEAWFIVLRKALPLFSHMGYVAVVLVGLTGIVNTALLVGSVDGLIGTPYGRLLLVKISLFLLLVVVAVINRLILVPWIGREALPRSGTSALRLTIGIEQMLGLGILVVVSVLGTWPPALHTHGQ
jgi:copper resistance protein D